MVIKKKRNVVNTTFDQGEKDESCLDLARVNSYTSESKEAIDRSKYLVTCTHSQKPLVVGVCEHCMGDAKQRSVATTTSA